MKTCPFCAEEIRDAATKCRYCDEWFDDRGYRTPAPEASPRKGGGGKGEPEVQTFPTQDALQRRYDEIRQEYGDRLSERGVALKIAEEFKLDVDDIEMLPAPPKTQCPPTEGGILRRTTKEIHDNAPVLPEPDHHLQQTKSGKTPVGLGGWLVVFMGMNILGLILLIPKTLSIHEALDRFDRFPYMLSKYPGWYEWIQFGFGFNIATAGAVALVFVFLIRQSAIAPRFIVSVFWFLFAVRLIHIAWGFQLNFSPGFLSSNVGSLVGFALGAVIWTLYFLRSKRVKNTFVT